MIKDLLIWENGHTHINGKIAFRYWSTFGIPPELFFEMIVDFMKKHTKERTKYIINAYNKTYGTQYSYPRAQ
jgi:hypothetical protein